MFSIKRNQVIVTALVVMIAVAGYLNIADSKKTAEAESGMVTYRELPDGTLIPDEELLEVSSADIEGEIGIAIDDPDATAETDLSDVWVVRNDTQSTPGQAIFVNSTAGNTTDREFFVSAKLEREQTRAKEKDILSEMLGNENLGKEDISLCATALLDIQKRIEKETAAEAMIEAKGFKEAYVRIDEDTVDVVVSKEALTEAEIAQIEDIVTRKTGFVTDKIKISTLKAAS